MSYKSILCISDLHIPYHHPQAFDFLKALKKKISFDEVLKSLKKRDKSDKNRKYGPLKKTKDSILINTTKLSRKRCFEKIKAIMDRKLKA